MGGGDRGHRESDRNCDCAHGENMVRPSALGFGVRRLGSACRLAVCPAAIRFPTMTELPPPPTNPPRYSASHLPADADPAEKEFVGLLAQALAPSYMLIRRLGAGGMGTVYVARDPVLKRLVAVKVMSPELSRDPDARTRFSREAQAVAALSHPNVVAVYAVGELENGLPYIVMQYVEGRSMAERVHEDGPLDVATAKRVLGEVAQALSATHRKGIIHRDIKPANILWDDESGRALVTDFGIAAVREHPDERGREAVKITQTGMAVGTPAYMCRSSSWPSRSRRRRTSMRWGSLATSC